MAVSIATGTWKFCQERERGFIYKTAGCLGGCEADVNEILSN